jgi:type 1 fimbriae regulatory protein FimB/type 1 fimbriae regulatory protein FimE
MAATHHLKVIGPTSEKCAVALPVRKPNAAYRSREHLTEREIERLIEAAKDNRWGIVTQPWSCWPFGTV